MKQEEILRKVQMQELTIKEALELLSAEGKSENASSDKIGNAGYEEMDFAKLDTGRKSRTGFAEVVFCEGKSIEQLRNIYKRIFELEGEVFGTRASLEQYEALSEEIPGLEYDPLSRVLMVSKKKDKIGKIVVCCAGTADIYAAEEAAKTAEFFGGNVIRMFDVGVCGIHRLLSKMEEMEGANCIVAVAGMEGALASVLGGLVSCPIIAVPTSVGYGASFGGLSALLTMINSCANGISVVNIDNGYGAGYIATQINRIGCKSN